MTQSELMFEPPIKQHADVLQELNTIFQPYADTAYGTFLTWWDLYDDLSFGSLNGNIIVQSSYPTLGKKLGHTIVGGNEIEKTATHLFDYQKEHNLETILYSIPEYQLVSLMNYKNIEVIREPDLAEYVLSAEQQAALSGKAFYMTRHKVNHFENAYGQAGIECQELNLNHNDTRALIASLSLKWGKSSKNDEDRLEEQIIHKSLRIHNLIKLRCFGIFVNHELVSLALYKLLPRGYVNLNHLKVCPDYKDIFTYTLHKLAVHLLEQGVTYINIEQDLGIEGLRTFKQRLRPVEMLHKYTVKLV